MTFYFDKMVETPDASKFRDAANADATDFAAGVALTGTYNAATLPVAASNPVLCLTREAIAVGKRGRVTAMAGIHPVLAGTGGFAAGDRLTIEANTGKFITWTAAGGANASIVGIAQEAATAGTYGRAELGVGAMGQG